MDYHTLLDVATELAYRVAMAGGETYRVEESVNHILNTYGINGEVFAIPNNLYVSIETPSGEFITRMKRIGFHGNDLDSVERYNNLSRKICLEKPEPNVALQWLNDVDETKATYKLPIYLLGNFLGACGFAVFFGGTLADSLCAGICGLLVGLVNRFMDNLKVNFFFSTIASSFIMALLAYGFGAVGLSPYPDTTIIGTLMILVPGLLFTNAMRDIIFGDTNSGINRIVQVLLIAAAIALGTGSAWRLSESLWEFHPISAAIAHNYFIQCLSSLIGCVGFTIIFNIHGRGCLLCAAGGFISWAAYCLFFYYFESVVTASFIAVAVAAIYSETMARIRKCPTISYLVISIFPLLPGAGIYYTANCIVRGDMDSFATQGMSTVAVAGALAVGILMISTIVKLWFSWKKVDTIRLK